MSRVARKPVLLPKGVEMTQAAGKVKVKGNMGLAMKLQSIFGLG